MIDVIKSKEVNKICIGLIQDRKIIFIGPPIDCDKVQSSDGTEMVVVNREMLKLRGWQTIGEIDPVIHVGGGQSATSIRSTVLASGRVLPSGCNVLEGAAQRGFQTDRSDAANLEVNESFLLHGLRPRVVAEIAKGGFMRRSETTHLRCTCWGGGPSLPAGGQRETERQRQRHRDTETQRHRESLHRGRGREADVHCNVFIGFIGALRRRCSRRRLLLLRVHRLTAPALRLLLAARQR